MFQALHSGSLTLHLIGHDNLADVLTQLQGYPDAPELVAELLRYYLPTYDAQGRRCTYGCTVRLHGELAGLVVLAVDDWDTLSGSLGADVLAHLRGRGVAPGTKPHLFYLAFELLGLNRVATGHGVSNVASQRSLAKTPGLVYEGRMRESGRNAQGELEDELLYAILRRDWQHLYDPAAVTVLY